MLFSVHNFFKNNILFFCSPLFFYGFSLIKDQKNDRRKKCINQIQIPKFVRNSPSNAISICEWRYLVEWHRQQHFDCALNSPDTQNKCNSNLHTRNDYSEWFAYENKHKIDKIMGKRCNYTTLVSVYEYVFLREIHCFFFFFLRSSTSLNSSAPFCLEWRSRY